MPRTTRHDGRQDLHYVTLYILNLFSLTDTFKRNKNSRRSNQKTKGDMFSFFDVKYYSFIFTTSFEFLKKHTHFALPCLPIWLFFVKIKR